MSLPRPPWSEESEAIWRNWWTQTPRDEIISRYTSPNSGEFVSNTAAVFIALQEALRGTGNVSPNPLVGCVIRTKDNFFISSGAHLKLGGPHAEINALAKLGQAGDPKLLEQAKVLVTLEPCSHYGKTPPCVDSLIKYPFKEITYLVEDPNPLVQGKGRDFLKAHGIDAKQDSVFSDLGEDLARVFLHNQRRQKMYVGLKAATTSEGAYAAIDSSRLWITSPRSREHGHFLRLDYDAILVGANTVLLDNPTLNIRSSYVTGRTPVRVVLDPKGVLDLSQDIFKHTANTRTILIRDPQKPLTNPLDVDAVYLPLNQSKHFEWKDILDALWKKDLRSLLIEGGGSVWESALKSGVVQRLHWYIGKSDQIQNSQVRKISLPKLNDPLKHQFGQDFYFEIDHF